MSRVYDMCLVDGKHYGSDLTPSSRCLVIHSCARGPIEFADVDLKSRTVTRAINVNEVIKLVFGGSAPYIVVVEQFVGARIMNTDNG